MFKGLQWQKEVYDGNKATTENLQAWQWLPRARHRTASWCCTWHGAGLRSGSHCFKASAVSPHLSLNMATSLVCSDGFLSMQDSERQCEGVPGSLGGLETYRCLWSDFSQSQLLVRAFMTQLAQI